MTGNNNRAGLAKAIQSSKRVGPKTTVRDRIGSDPREDEEGREDEDEEDEGDEVEIYGDQSYAKHIGKGHAKKGQVLALRARSTKKISASSGFRKHVWKTVCLVLRKESMELFKTPSEETSHQYIDLSEVEAVERKEGLEAGFEIWHIDGSVALQLRALSEAEADEWVGAIHEAAAL